MQLMLFIKQCLTTHVTFGIENASFVEISHVEQSLRKDGLFFIGTNCGNDEGVRV